MAVFGRTFKPGWPGTVATLLLLPVLSSLGVWQLHRAAYKRDLAAQATAGQQSTATLNGASAASLRRYQHVSASGRYESARQVLLDNMPSKTGQPGYRVLTPFRLDDGAVVLVDRGWVPLGASREQLPAIEVSPEPRTLHGVVDELPQPGVRLGAASAGKRTWPAVLNYPRSEELKALYNEPLQQHIVLLDASDADGYERHWQANAGFGPERHIGYAVQWFGLALALLCIYVGVNLKRVENT